VKRRSRYIRRNDNVGQHQPPTSANFGRRRPSAGYGTLCVYKALDKCRRFTYLLYVDDAGCCRSLCRGWRPTTRSRRLTGYYSRRPSHTKSGCPSLSSGDDRSADTYDCHAHRVIVTWYDELNMDRIESTAMMIEGSSITSRYSRRASQRR